MITDVLSRLFTELSTIYRDLNENSLIPNNINNIHITLIKTISVTKDANHWRFELKKIRKEEKRIQNGLFKRFIFLGLL